MSASNPGIYTPINVHATDSGIVWPASIPELTAPEAVRAARRLWRYSVGTTFDGVVKVTRGNRRTRIDWDGNERCIIVNPEEGWREFIHALSHWFDYVVNGEMKHGKHHARFETKLIKEVIRRGWLDGKLKDHEPETNVIPIVDPKIALRRQKLARIEARLVNWDRKLQRAQRAIAKLTKQQRYYVKALA